MTTKVHPHPRGAAVRGGINPALSPVRPRFARPCRRGRSGFFRAGVTSSASGGGGMSPWGGSAQGGGWWVKKVFVFSLHPPLFTLHLLVDLPQADGAVPTARGEAAVVGTEG